jgi:hypothetical protein
MELLNKDRQKELLAQPESGMGYQTVDVVMRKGENLRGTVFNTEYLLYSGEPVGLLAKLANPSERLQMLVNKEVGSGEEIVELKVVTTKANAPGLVRESDEPQTTGASEATEEGSKNDEEFRRFCAFANDRRVTSTGGLSPGTYATTAADAKQVKTGSDAVRRYALPNPMPAVYKFTIKPPAQTPLKRGIVQPAYRQPGGGVEVLFVNGSPPNTVTSSPPPLPPLP